MKREPLLLVRTESSWWRAAEDTNLDCLDLSMRAYNALLDAGACRAADVHDLDLVRFADRRQVGTRIVEEVALLRDVLRHRARVPSPDRAAFEAALPRNRIPPSWQTVLEDDRVEALGLSKRARGALAAAGAATASDLLDLTLVELCAQRGIGKSTLVELEDLFKVLHWRFSDHSVPREDSLDAFFEDVYPRAAPRQRSTNRHAVLLRYLGLHPGERRSLGSWASQKAIADDLGITASTVHSAVAKARAAWCHPRCRRIRNELNAILEDHGGTATAARLAEQLLARRGSAASPGVRRQRAGAVVRAGADGEAARRGAARFRARRRAGEVFVALIEQASPRTVPRRGLMADKAPKGGAARLLSKLEREILHEVASPPGIVDLADILKSVEIWTSISGRLLDAPSEPPVERQVVYAALRRLQRLGFVDAVTSLGDGQAFRLTPWGKATTTLCAREQRRWLGDGGGVGLFDVEVIPDRRRVAETFEELAVDFLDLSTRASNALRRLGIKTAGALTAMTAKRVREVRGVGRRTVEEIEMELSTVGLELNRQA